MRRTTISLPDEVADALEREARRRALPVSAIARQALIEHLRIGSGAPRALPFAALGGSGTESTARDMERLIEQEWSADAGRR